MKLLFMCVANSARSQLAEGLAKKMFPNAEIRSAGSHPTEINHRAIEVMKEIGIDISAQYSKSVGDLAPGFIASLDYVITLCAEEVCPVVLSKAKKLHWPQTDPASKETLPAETELQRFRTARDAISSCLRKFSEEIR